MNLQDAQSFIDLAITQSTPNSPQWLTAQAAKATIEGIAQELYQIQEQQNQIMLYLQKFPPR